MGTLPLDQVAEVHEQLRDHIAGRHRITLGVGGHDALGPPVESRSIGGRHSQVVGDHEAGERLEQLGHDVAATGRTETLDPFHREGPHRRLELLYVPRREPLAHQATERSVFRRIHHDHRRGLGETGLVPLVVLERQSLRGREGGGVACRSEDVVEAREHPVVAPGIGVGDTVNGVVVTEAGVHGPRRPPGVAGAGHEPHR